MVVVGEFVARHLNLIAGTLAVVDYRYHRKYPLKWLQFRSHLCRHD